MKVSPTLFLAKAARALLERLSRPALDSHPVVHDQNLSCSPSLNEDIHAKLVKLRLCGGEVPMKQRTFVCQGDTVTFTVDDDSLLWAGRVSTIVVPRSGVVRACRVDGSGDAVEIIYD